MTNKRYRVREGVGTVSEHAGVLIGSVTATGKKVLAAGGKGIAGIGRSILSIGRRKTAIVHDEISEGQEIESEVFTEAEEQEAESEVVADTEAKAPELEFKLADAQRELDHARRKANEAQLQLTSQMDAIQKERTAPLLDLKGIVRPITSQLDTVREKKAAQLELQTLHDRARQTKSEPVKQTREPSNKIRSYHNIRTLPEVTSDDIRRAVFSIEAERDIVMRALSDIESKNEKTRTEATEALGSIRHELAVRILVNSVPSESSARVRARCIGALTELGMVEGLPTVKHTLTDQDACVRLAAVKGVYRLAGAQSIPMLITALSDEDDNVRHRAYVLTGWLGRHDMAIEMRKLLKNPVQDSTLEGGQQSCEHRETAR